MQVTFDSGIKYFKHYELSCGIGLLGDIWDTPIKIVLKDLCANKNMGEIPDAAYIIFSDADEEGNGIKLAQYISEIPEKYNCNNVYETGPKVNPNSGNDIRVWVWDINFEGLTEFVKDNEL